MSRKSRSHRRLRHHRPGPKTGTVLPWNSKAIEWLSVSHSASCPAYGNRFLSRTGKEVSMPKLSG